MILYHILVVLLAVIFEVDKETAEEMAKSFLECIAAPSFSDEALEVLKSEKKYSVNNF